MPFFRREAPLRSRVLLGAGILTCLSAFATYRLWVEGTRRQAYRIFDVDRTVSWVENRDGVYRIDAKEGLDNVLSSTDVWREATLWFTLIHPRHCGVVFRRRGEAGFGFIVFNGRDRRILCGIREGGRLIPLAQAALPRSPIQPYVLELSRNRLRLSSVGRSLIDVALPEGEGRLGLLINDAASPRTIFHDVRISGTLASGRRIRARSPPALSRSDPWRGLIALPFFVTLMILAAVAGLGLRGMAVRRVPCMVRDTKRDVGSPWFAVLWHLGLTVWLFWPFVFRGEILVSSYDNLGEIYPLLFLSKHNAAAILGGRSLGLWNPYLLDGMPFFTNHWNMIFYPLNWPLFFLPDRLFLTGVTLRVFLEVFLLGLLAFGLFRRELGSSSWALLSSTVYQTCSILIFSFTVFPAVSTYFAMTAFLYVLWSMSGRRARWNYLLLTGATVLLATSANMAFVFYAALLCGVMAVYRIFVTPSGRLRVLGLVGAAVVSGAVISAVRWLPCLWGVAASNRLSPHFFTLHDRAFLWIRLFLPEITGRYGTDGFPVLTSSNLGLVFASTDLPSNPQNAFFAYFGVIPVLLAVGGLGLPGVRRRLFWTGYTAAALAATLWTQPVWGVLSILTFPFIHFSYHLLILPLGICALVGHAGVALESRPPSARMSLWAGGTLLAALLGIGIFLVYLFPAAAPVARWILLIGCALGVAGGISARRSPGLRLRWNWAGLLALNVLVSAAFALAASQVILRPLLHKETLAAVFLLPVFGLWIVLTWASYAVLPRSSGRPRPIVWAAAGGTALAVIFGLLSSPLFTEIYRLSRPHHGYFVDVTLGLVRIAILAQAVALILVLHRRRRLSGRALPRILLILTTLDLMAFNFRFDNITAPFYFNRAFYPRGFHYAGLDPALRERLDLENYRVADAHRVGLSANQNVVFGIPSYTGTVGYMPRRYARFLAVFGFPEDVKLLYPQDGGDDERFLDLSAVRYVFESAGRVRLRPSSLARGNLLFADEVVPDPERLRSRLRSPDWDPHRRVLLARRPAGAPAPDPERRSQELHVTSSSSDRVVFHVDAPRPAYLVFVESYDPGWTASVDGRPAEVVPANGDFMACVVPAGRHEVVFRYAPPGFFALLKVSSVASAVFLIILIVSVVERIRRRSAIR